MSYWVFGNDFDWLTFDFDHDMDTLDDALAAGSNTNTADLEEFKSHGGKLILAHGFADPRVPTLNTVAYYERLIASQTRDGRHDEGERNEALRRTQEFARLFLFPGVGHCDTGARPDTVEGDTLPAGPTYPAGIAKVALDPIVQWVEHGIAPDQIIAYKVTGGVTAFSRPVCPIRHYRGTRGSASRQKPIVLLASLTATATTTSRRPRSISTMAIITLWSRLTTATTITTIINTDSLIGGTKARYWSTSANQSRRTE